MTDGYLSPFFFFFLFLLEGVCKPQDCLARTVLCLSVSLKIHKSTLSSFKNNIKMVLCFSSAHTVKGYMCLCSLVNLYIEMSSLSLYLLRNVFQKPLFSLCSESNVSLWETQLSFSFSLNKMKPFLTVHQADPLSLLYQVVLSLTCNSKSICVIFCCINWTGALLSACLTHGRHPRLAQSTEEGSGGVGEGNFTALAVCLLGGNLCAILPDCHMQYNLSRFGLGEQTGAYERVDPRAAFSSRR